MRDKASNEPQGFKRLTSGCSMLSEVDIAAIYLTNSQLRRQTGKATSPGPRLIIKDLQREGKRLPRVRLRRPEQVVMVSASEGLTFTSFIVTPGKPTRTWYGLTKMVGFCANNQRFDWYLPHNPVKMTRPKTT